MSSWRDDWLPRPARVGPNGAWPWCPNIDNPHDRHVTNGDNTDCDGAPGMVGPLKHGSDIVAGHESRVELARKSVESAERDLAWALEELRWARRGVALQQQYLDLIDAGHPHDWVVAWLGTQDD